MMFKSDIKVLACNVGVGCYSWPMAWWVPFRLPYSVTGTRGLHSTLKVARKQLAENIPAGTLDTGIYIYTYIHTNLGSAQGRGGCPKRDPF